MENAGRKERECGKEIIKEKNKMMEGRWKGNGIEDRKEMEQMLKRKRRMDDSKNKQKGKHSERK